MLRVPSPRLLPLMRPLPWAVVAGYFVVFLLLDWASFIRPLQHLNITPWNPQPALAVALLLASHRLWWVVWASVLAADILVRGLPGDLFVAAAAAAALTCSYLVIAGALQRVLRGGWRLADVRAVEGFFGVVAAGALLNAVVYVGVFAVGGFAVGHPLWEAVARYWVGDAVGMMVALPAVLVAMDAERRQLLLHALRDRRWWLIALVVCLLLWGLLALGPADSMAFSYVLLLPVVWGAMRFGAVGALLSAAVTQVGLIVTVQAVQHQDLVVFELQLLMAAVTMTGLLLGVIVDERQRADAELRRSLRLVAAGQMSAALAHELSQPLTALVTYAQACELLARRDAPRGPQAQAQARVQMIEVTRRIASDARRAGEVIRHLRDFFRSGATMLQATNLAPLVCDALVAQSARALTTGVRLAEQWPSTLPPVLIDVIQIEVVLRNLVTNAIDAASPRGAAGLVSVRGSLSAQGLLVEVIDNGAGVRPADAAAIFEAGESDKAGGMGIGLGICRAIVEAHGGRLWVQPGDHGHFCFTLPMDAPSDESTPGQEPRHAP